MCRSKRPAAPDTSAQVAESKRQFEIQLQQAELDRQLQKELFERQLTAEQQRYQEQQAAAQAEWDRQRQESEAATAAERARQEQVAAAQEAERAAAAQLAQERADRAAMFSQGRRDRLATGRAEIEGAYAGFDDNYFSQFEQDFIGANRPELERDYRDRIRSNRLALADRGNLNSTAAAMFFGDLAREKASTEAALASSAKDAAQQFRNTVAAQKGDDINAFLSAGFISNQDLPDGVTDVSQALGDIDAEIGLLTGDARRRAQSITRPGFASIRPNRSSVDDLTVRNSGGNRVVSGGSPSYSTLFGNSSYTVGG